MHPNHPWLNMSVGDRHIDSPDDCISVFVTVKMINKIRDDMANHRNNPDVSRWVEYD